MPVYVEIAVNVPQVSGVFHYHLPPHLEGQVDLGYLVTAPFGKQRVQGVVLRFVDVPAVSITRPVEERVDTQAVLTPTQIALARQISEACLAPLAACISLMLPPGLLQQADILYELAGEDQAIKNPEPSSGAQPGQIQSRLIALLKRRGALRGRQIDASIPRVDWRSSARSLAQRGVLRAQSVLPAPSIQPKNIRTAQIACPPEVVESNLPTLARAGTETLARRQAILRFLLQEAAPVAVAWVYAESGGSRSDLQALAEQGLVFLGESEVWRDPLETLDVQPSHPPPLTADQHRVVQEVLSSVRLAAQGQETRPILLHGVTGSGKTEVYLRAIEAVLKMGRQAILLVPEIALTPQTVRRVAGRFPGQVGLLHSGLSNGERYDTWRRARQAEIQVMVGPRSALFTPFPNLGLIVVDECHDDSYHQSENPPYYHAREAALEYARLAGAVCLLGSATPDLVSSFRAQRGQYTFLSLPARILAHREVVQAQIERLRPEMEKHGSAALHFHPLEGEAQTGDLPPVEVVDMRQELRQGNRSMFSRPLQAELASVLSSGQQAILFLNRRGASTYVFCRECGYVLRCPRCDLPLIYHSPTGSELAARESPSLRCHHCDYRRKMPAACPACGSKTIRQYGAGTEKVEAEVKALFPLARILRWDHETTRKKGAHEIILSHFAAHRADILVGTQMLAKGLDLPWVTLVGAVLADVGLNLPDYRAPERTFQVLTQVAGRAGRSPLGGKVVLQTFQPEHYVIQAAAHHDYSAFYEQELEYRRKLSYPPFTQLARLEFRHAEADQAERAANNLAAQLQRWIETEDRRMTSLIGPVPAFFARLGGDYRWQIILRGPDPASLLRDHLASSVFGGWRIEVNPSNLL